MAQRLAQIAVSAARSCSALAAPPQEAGLLAATLRLLGSAELQCGARLLHISPLQRQGNEQAAEDVQRKAVSRLYCNVGAQPLRTQKGIGV